jgi:hypothetical protein
MSGPVSISGFTVYRDVDEVDDQFSLSDDASFILRGGDILTDDTIAGNAVVRVDGLTTIDDNLVLYAGVIFANAGTVAQVGALSIDIGPNITSVTVRNLAGAIYELSGSIYYQGNQPPQFINYGQFEGYGEVEPNFYDRGGTIVAQATLTFDGSVARFMNDTIEGAGALDLVRGGVLDGSNVSVDQVNLSNARILGDVTMSSANVSIGGTSFGQGADLVLTNSVASLVLGEITGGEIDIKGNDSVQTDDETFLQGPANLDNFGDTIFGAGAVANGVVSAGGTYFRIAPWADNTLALENETGATWTDVGDDSVFEQYVGAGSIFMNNGTFVENTTGGAIFGIDVVNNGVMEGGGKLVTGGDQFVGLYFEGSLSGDGTVDIGDANVYAAGAVESGQTLNFAPVSGSSNSPTLTLADAPGFSGVISGFDQNGATTDQIALGSNWQFQDFVANGGNTGGSLMFTDGSETTAINLSGTYQPSDFHAVVTAGQTIVSYG